MLKIMLLLFNQAHRNKRNNINVKRDNQKPDNEIYLKNINKWMFKNMLSIQS